jgi:pathogenesis-related protein 1
MTIAHTRRWLRVLSFALVLASCGEDGDARPEPELRDAGRKRDAAVRADAKAPDGEAREADEEDPEEDDTDDGEVVPDARARDAGTDARVAGDDAATRDASAAGDASAGVDGEKGRMVGMTAAHNAVRAMVETTMSLPELTWSNELAAYAQEWADNLATTTCLPKHRTGAELQAKGYGENWAFFTSFGSTPSDTAKTAVGLWASEKECWTYGTFWESEKCDVACYQAKGTDGCGHYTQIVWRESTQVGCGLATCSSSGQLNSIWICNYAPAGNFIGQKPY